MFNPYIYFRKYNIKTRKTVILYNKFTILYNLYMIIVGYHATNKANAKKILKKGFMQSKGDKEWLGSGIYFYLNIQDALEWRRCDTILCTFIKVGEKDILDIDSDKGKRKYLQATNKVIEKAKTLKIELDKDAQKNQCAVVNLIWDLNKNIKLIESSLPKEKRKINTLFDPRKKRKEMCIRDKKMIKKIISIDKEDLK